MLAKGALLFVPARDGYLYAFSPEKKENVWQRRIGQYGDLPSDLGAGPVDLLIGTVSGEVVSVLSDSGKARWRIRLRGAVLAAPVTSPGGQWVAAASLAGDVAIVDAEKGQPKGAFQAEDEIIAAPVFFGDLLIVGSADRRLYELQVPTCTPRRAVEFPAGISTALVACGKMVVFATADGSLHAYSPQEGKALWSCPLGSEAAGPAVTEGELLFVTTTGGQILRIEPRTGAVLWRVDLSRGRPGRPILSGPHLLIGSESGELVSLAVADGSREWSFKADASILASPLAAGGSLYVPCISGKILILEEIE
jgi:outer membrane protein assembly factor BamB